MNYSIMITRQGIMPLCIAVGLTALVIFMASAATTDPPDKTVRVFIVFPSDIPVDSAYPRGIGKVMISSQKYFLTQCKYTFRLNNPICEVVKGSHPTSWYTNPDDYWTIVNQGTEDLYSQYPTIKADGNRAKWKLVIYVNAQSPQDGGGGGGGWVGLPKHDADGAKGYPKDTARWCGGMCHELGHCFGLPDASHDDGTVMSADFYHWPVNCVFTASQTNTMKSLAANSGFWVDNITGTEEYFGIAINAPMRWTPLIRGNQLEIPFSVEKLLPAAVVLYNLSGKRVSLCTPSTVASKVISSTALSNGTYIISLKSGVLNESQKLKIVK
jgi:hypothetical protein